MTSPAAIVQSVAVVHADRALHHAALQYVGLSLAAAASWFGVPGPGEPVLIAAAVLAAQRHLSLVPVIIVAGLAATGGSMLGWLLGIRGGRALLTAPGPMHRMRLSAVDRGEALFQRHEVIGILLTPSWIAGINEARWRLFLAINAITAALWAVGIGLGGYYVGPRVIDVVDDVGLGTGILLAVLIVAAVGLEIRRRSRAGGRRRRRFGGEREPGRPRLGGEREPGPPVTDPSRSFGREDGGTGRGPPTPRAGERPPQPAVIPCPRCHPRPPRPDCR
ncbi:MAG: DedA family protein [Solirubrobacterales bacterium]|nr:DedA family protein [Solirubrobacterales bacterium]